MTPQELIIDLAMRGVALRTDGVRIWPEPKGALTPKNLADIAPIEGDIIAYLQEPTGPVVVLNEGSTHHADLSGPEREVRPRSRKRQGQDA